MPAATEKMTFKVVVVGDGTVGKTCYLQRFVNDKYSGIYAPTIFDNITFDLKKYGLPAFLTLWDTAGQEDYDRLRPLSYSDADLYIICYAVCSKDSLENVTNKWLPEIEKHHEGPLEKALIGLKADMRVSGFKSPETEEAQSSPAIDPKDLVVKKDAEEIAAKNDFLVHFECTNLVKRDQKVENLDTVEESFIQTIKKLIDKKYGKKGKKGKKSKCLVF